MRNARDNKEAKTLAHMVLADMRYRASEWLKQTEPQQLTFFCKVEDIVHQEMMRRVQQN